MGRVLGVFAVFSVLLLSNAEARLEAIQSLKILEGFENHFQAQVREESGGKSLRINTMEEVDSNTAQPFTTPDSFLIKVYGGMLRDPGLTSDVFELVLCHELGHFLGGWPKGQWKILKKADGTRETVYLYSVEGQADYYAAGVCLKSLWAKRPSPQVIDLPQFVIDECKSTYSVENEQQLCMKIAQAGYAYASQLGPEKISFLTPDPQVMNSLWQAHPKPQCRLDTFFAGALNRPRPSCWYAD